MRIRIAALILLLLPLWRSALTRGDFPQTLQLLTQDAPDRSAGSPTALRNADDLATQASLLPGSSTYRQPFLLTLPVIERCRARALMNPPAAEALFGVPAAEEIPLAPLLPSGGQAAALAPHRAIAGLLYARSGSLEDLKGQTVAHQFVALDISSGPTAWQRIASLGASAIIFLGDAGTPNTDFLSKATTIPLGTPRFYCDDPAAVARIRSGQIPALAIDVQIRWEERRVENVLCLIPGRQLTPNLSGVKDPHWIDQLIVLQARSDASSQVLTRGAGATQAANAALLLELGRRIAGAPDHCAVLLAFSAGDQWNFRGTRALLDLIDRGARNRAAAIADLQQEVRDAEGRRATAADTLAGIVAIAQGRLEALAGEAARSAIEDQLTRQTARVEDQLQRARLVPNNDGAVRVFESQKQSLRDAAAALDPASPRSPAQIAAIQAAAEAITPQWRTEFDRASALLETLSSWPATRHDLRERPPLLFLSLALTPNAPHVGLFWRSHYSNLPTGQMTAFAQPFRRYAANAPDFLPESLENRFSLETFFPNPTAFPSDAALLRGQAAAAFATVQDAAPFLDTPNDTTKNLSADNFAAQTRTLARLLLGEGQSPGALSDPLFYGRTDLPDQTADQPVTLFEHAGGETLAHLRAAQTLIGGQCVAGDRPLTPPLVGVVPLDWYLTDIRGAAVFRSAVRLFDFHTRMQAFAFDDAGLPTRTLIANQADVRGLAADFLPNPAQPVRAMLFECTRLDAYGLFDPRYLETLDNVDILDARRLDKAQFTNIYTDQDAGAAAVFLSPDIRWQMLVSKGNVANRMVLINADALHPDGVGFDTTDLAAIGPLSYRTARDLFALNSRRKSDLERFGISNEVLTQLHAAAAPQLAAAEKAEKTQDYPALFASADAAWSLEAQVYANLIDTSNSIIRGVIFLLLGIIPFSYFLERLLIGATNIYRQIGWFAAIFGIMTLLLWGHPAFRISAAPLMILLAFLILILSSTVVYILYGKFEEEIAILRKTGAGVHSTSLHRAAVLGAAIRLGLSNMRRRGTRTALTLATLILLTFTLLCFTSVREAVQISPQVVAPENGLPPPPPGLLLRQPDWRDLPPAALDLAYELAPPSATIPTEVAGRWWYASERAEQSWAIPIRPVTLQQDGGSAPASEPSAFNVSALLGLDPQEADFHANIDRVLAHFSSYPRDAAVCWLPAKAREALPLHEGDDINLLGHTLQIAGFFDNVSFSTLRQLNGDPLTPFDPTGAAPLPGGQSNGFARRTESATHFYAPDSVIVVPSAVVRQLRGGGGGAGGRLTSIIIRPGPAPDQIDRVATELAQRSAFTLFVSDGRQIRSINATEAARHRDLATVIVPMLLCAAIVLNTMLGAVAERTREIHVYTSVGLAPAHVGMLFLAEAAALGTIGVVFGYIAGQGAATLLSHTHLLPGVDLNYSSYSAISTMGMVLGIVMLSALWPAHAATRIAAPSLQRDWKLPRAVGDLLAVDLPFTVNETAARGVCAFLEEYLLTTTQSGTGHFTADNLAPIFENPSRIAGREIRGLFARIWLAPYDLGVIQTMRLTIHPTDQAGGAGHVFDVHMQITREAGNPGAWHRLNRPFLTEIRKQFLLWRNIEGEALQKYLTRSDQMFHRMTDPKMTNDK